MIQLENIKKSFNDHVVLNDINLSLEKGKTHILLGSSGGGKSTLLKIIMGLLKADWGQIRIFDTLLTPKTQKQILKMMGYVVQEGGLFPHLTAAQNTTLVAKLRGWTKDEIGTRLETLAHLVGFKDDLLKRYPSELSSGQRQRVGLIRALMLDPSILILDEPLNALDPLIRSDLQNDLKEIFKKLKKTVLLVTHDIMEACFLGDTITLLHQGKIEQSGTFQDLVQNPSTEFVSRFLRAQKPPPGIKELFQ